MKVLDNSQWIQTQFEDCPLGDQRRNDCVQRIATKMLRAPEKSLPQQNPDWKDLKAAYRLFASPSVTFAGIAQPHWQQTRQTKPGRYLLISDTTDISQRTHQATTGMGILGDGRGRGLQLHNCLMYDCGQQQIRGMAGVLVNYRKRVPKKETSAQVLKRIRESQLWGNLVNEIGPPPQGSQWIHVFDRGGDNFESMCHIKLSHCDFVIRASKLNRNVLDDQGNTVPLREAIEDAKRLGSYELSLRSRRGVKARTAKMEVLSCSITMPRPRHKSPWLKQCSIDQLAVNVVIVQEVSAPKGIKPIRWVLLTSQPATTFAAAWQVIEDYENRWMVEEYHKVIKTGCSAEQHALRTADRLEALLGLISVIGVRLFQMKLIGRSQPDAKATTHVPSSWLRCLKIVKPKLATKQLSVYEFFRELAKLGGFLGRTHDGEPGWQTTWRGYQVLQQHLDSMRLVNAI